MAASNRQHGGSRLKPLPATIAGVVVGAMIAGGLAVNGIPEHADTDQHLRPVEGQRAARSFLDAWRRSRLSSWSVDAVFTRSGPKGERLSVAVHRAQRPPDRLLTGLGTVNARRGDVELVCAGGERAPSSLRCREGRALVPYEEEVEAEMRLLRRYVLGADALYAVRQEGRSCFRLRLRFELPSPPYGRLAVFCFDEETGAPTRAEIRRDQGTDVTRSVRIKADPDEEDLAPPPEAGAPD